MLALLEHLAAHLLGARQNGLGLADAQRRGPGAGVDALHQRADQLLVLALELLHHLAALAVADALADDVARRLRRDASELLGAHRYIHVVSDLDGGIDLARLLQQDLFARLPHVVDGDHLQPHLEHAGLRVQVDDGVLVVIAVLARRENGLLDLFEHEFHGDAAFLFEQLQRLKNLIFIVFGLVVLFLRRSPCHLNCSLHPRPRHPAGAPWKRPPFPA